MGHNRARERWKARMKRHKKESERLAKKDAASEVKVPAKK